MSENDWLESLTFSNATNILLTILEYTVGCGQDYRHATITNIFSQLSTVQFTGLLYFKNLVTAGDTEPTISESWDHNSVKAILIGTSFTFLLSSHI